jgi:hypothetical protein
MDQSHSDRIKDFFAVRSHDITPVPVRHAAHVLYAPVSNDPEITRCCASVLSEIELQRAERETRGLLNSPESFFSAAEAGSLKGMMVWQNCRLFPNSGVSRKPR